MTLEEAINWGLSGIDHEIKDENGVTVVTVKHK